MRIPDPSDNHNRVPGIYYSIYSKDGEEARLLQVSVAPVVPSLNLAKPWSFFINSRHLLSL